VYTQTEIGALRSIGRNLVMTVLTRRSSDFTLILDMAAFRGKVTVSIVGAWTGNRCQFIVYCTSEHYLLCLWRALCSIWSLSSLVFRCELTHSAL